MKGAQAGGGGSFARRPRPILFLPLALIFGLAATACAERPQVVIATSEGAVVVDVEIAATRPKRSLGLMFRDKLDPSQGMLFVFGSSQDHQFWMKNTKLALDIIFISEEEKVVGVIESARPFSTQTLSIGRPSKFALEVAAGFCARRGIKTGTRVAFRGFDPSKLQVDPD